jgi:hypothetical protein
MSRTKTGLRRKKPLQVHFNDDESEWLARESFRHGISRAALIRKMVIVENYFQGLVYLRKKQKLVPRKNIFGKSNA